MIQDPALLVIGGSSLVVSVGGITRICHANPTDPNPDLNETSDLQRTGRSDWELSKMVGMTESVTVSVTTPGKRDRMDALHVLPLHALVREWRARLPAAQIPSFDPDDGGINARVLILMESPAPTTVGHSGTGFCSEDNDDRSNRRLREIRRGVGLSRDLCLKWNAVPWAVLDSGGHPRTPTSAELDTATPYLLELLEAAPKIEVVITLGKTALSAFTSSTTLSATRRLYRLAAAPHPSQRNARAHDAAMERIANAFRNAARYAAGADAVPGSVD